MLHLTIRRSRGPAQTLEFQVLVVERESRSRTVTLKAVCGPDDDGSPCITVLFPQED
jgi:hypothetical protein